MGVSFSSYCTTNAVLTVYVSYITSIIFFLLFYFGEVVSLFHFFVDSILDRTLYFNFHYFE